MRRWAAIAPVPVERVGVKDRFGEVGPIDYLKQVMGPLPSDIAVAAKSQFPGNKVGREGENTR